MKQWLLYGYQPVKPGKVEKEAVYGQDSLNLLAVYDPIHHSFYQSSFQAVLR
jgi:hypothetical protein